MIISTATIKKELAVLDDGDGFPGEMIAGVGHEGEEEDGDSVDEDSGSYWLGTQTTEVEQRYSWRKLDHLD